MHLVIDSQRSLVSYRKPSRFCTLQVLKAGRALLLAALLAAFCTAQELVQVLPQKTQALPVIEFLVTPWGLYPATLEVPPGDYVLVVRRKGFEAPLNLTVVEVTGRKIPIASLTNKTRKALEVVRLRTGDFSVRAFESSERAFTANLRVDSRFVERRQSNDRPVSAVP